MAGTIYEKSTRALLRDMLKAWDLKPGQVFTAQRALQWFQEHYPKLRSTTINAHLVQASTNNKNRLHHQSTNESDDLLFRVGRGEFRLYEPGRDSAPIHELVAGDVARQEAAAPDVDEDADEDAPAVGRGADDARVVGTGSTEFLLERDLQLFLAKHLDRVEAGLMLYDDEGVVGLEFEAGGGRRIDILATDAAGGLVVIELKVSKGYDRVVGQLLRYVNWVKMNLAEKGQRVRGIIICRTMTDDLRLACAGIPDVELYEYQMSVSVSRVAAMEL
jgi:hypothetical protein